jgi:hypothetical protein
MKNEQEDRVFDGCAYVSGNGQLVIDRHASDEEHLIARHTRAEQPLYGCRTYLRDLFPRSWIGVSGQYDIHYAEDGSGGVAGVVVVFTPDALPAARGASPGDLPGEPSR